MKRYLLFAGDSLHPQGGWDDFIRDGNTELELAFLTTVYCRDEDETPWLWEIEYSPRKQLICDWWEIVDTQTKEVVHFEGTKEKESDEFEVI